jgi:putative membrane protein
VTQFLLRLIMSAGAVLLAQAIFPDLVRVGGLVDALLFAFVLGVLNALVRPVLLLLTCPLNLLTLGLFIFVVNAAVFGLAAWLLPGVAVAGFLGAFVGALIVSIVSAVASYFIR